MKIYRLTDVVIEKERSSMPSSINFFILYTAQWVYNLFAYFFFWTFSWNSDSCVKKIKNVKKDSSLLIHGIKLKLIKGFGSFVSWVKFRTQMDRISKIELPTEILLSHSMIGNMLISILHFMPLLLLFFHSIVHLTMTR